MTEHNKLDERLQELSTVLTQVLAAQEDERRVVNRSLQEEIGQALTALALNLRVLEGRCDHLPCLALIGEMRGLVASALGDVDRLQRTLYPPALESQGLIPAVEMYIREFAHSNQIRVELDAEMLSWRLPTVVEVSLFRILQDALDYVRQQPAVSEVHLGLRFIKEHVYLVIEADGAAGAAGWRNALIVERAAALGGCCAMMPNALAGTRLEVALPIHRKESP